MPRNWPFDSILSTVVLSSVSEALSSEGYEFGGYFFYAEEMKRHGQFKGNKLERIGSNLLLGVSHGPHQTSNPTANQSPPKAAITPVSGSSGNTVHTATNNRASFVIRKRRDS